MWISKCHILTISAHSCVICFSCHIRQQSFSRWSQTCSSTGAGEMHKKLSWRDASLTSFTASYWLLARSRWQFWLVELIENWCRINRLFYQTIIWHECFLSFNISCSILFPTGAQVCAGSSVTLWTRSLISASQYFSIQTHSSDNCVFAVSLSTIFTPCVLAMSHCQLVAISK